MSGRKLFSFSNAVGEAVNFVNNSKRLLPVGNASLSPERVLPVIRSAAMFNFWVSDHAVFLAKWAKVAHYDVAWHSTAASRFWFVAILCNVALDTMEYRRKAKEEADDSDDDDDNDGDCEAQKSSAGKKTNKQTNIATLPFTFFWLNFSLFFHCLCIDAFKKYTFKCFRNACDLVVATNNSKFMEINPIFVNVCGAISAAAFLYDAWK